MNARKTGDLPADQENTRRRMGEWRQRHQAATPLLESLWTQAVKLAGRYGISRTARALEVVRRPLQDSLQSLDPLHVEQVRRTPQELLFNSLIEQQHHAIRGSLLANRPLMYARLSRRSPVKSCCGFVSFFGGLANWELARRQLPLRAIEPLE